MNALGPKIEAILFMSSRPVSFGTLAKMTESTESDVQAAIEDLQSVRNTDDFGVHVVVADRAAELSTHPGLMELVASLSKEETEGELTRPQLEALTIIAYRGPITKAEIEYIRGVNCSLIIRNLLMRGLIIETEDATRLQNVYTISTEMLRHLGVHQARELPDYADLHVNARITKMLSEL